MSGYEEAALIVELYPELAGALAGGSEVAGYGAGSAAVAEGAGAAWGLGAGAAGAGAGAGAGSWAEYAAMEDALAAQQADAALYGSAGYGAGDTVTDGLLGSESYSQGYGAGSTVNDSLANTETQNMLGNMKNAAANAFNKVGGAVNKLPAPVQGMVMSGLLGAAVPRSGPATASPHAAPPQGQATPSSPSYNQQPHQSQGLLNTFGSSYGPKETPEEIEMMKRRRRLYG